MLGALTRFGESAEQEAQPLSANDQEIVEAYVGSEPAAIDAASETGGDEMAAGEERSDSGTK